MLNLQVVCECWGWQNAPDSYFQSWKSNLFLKTPIALNFKFVMFIDLSYLRIHLNLQTTKKRSVFWLVLGQQGTLTFLTSELPSLLGKKWATLLRYDIQFQHMLSSTWPQLTDQEWQRIPDSTNKYKLHSQKKKFY